MKLGKKTQFVFYILLVLILSCNNNKDFNVFFNKLKKDSVINLLSRANCFFQLRGECYYDFELDSIRIIFFFTNNCEPEIKSVQNVARDEIIEIENYNKKELESIIIQYINLMSEVDISLFENMQKNYLLIYFRLDDIDKSTLPDYSIKDTNDNNKDKLGVLVYDYTNKYVNLTQFSYYKPIEVASKWYYYEVYFDIDCDCL